MNYHNPHPVQQRQPTPLEIYQAQQAAARNQYGQQQPPQDPYRQNGGYQQPPQNSIVVMNTPQGQVYVDQRTNAILGPVNQQPQQPQYAQSPQYAPPQQQYARPGNASNAFQADMMINNNGYTPMAEATDNRYGNIRSLTNPAGQVNAGQAPEQKPPPPPVKKEEPVTSLPGLKFKTQIRSTPFAYRDIKIVESSAVGETLEHIVMSVIEKGYDKDNSCAVTVQTGVIVDKHFDLSMEDYEDNLFQNNGLAVFKILLRNIPDIMSVAELAYYQRFNRWLTRNVNDMLAVITSGKTNIGSFAEDYADLIKLLEEKHPEDVKTLTNYIDGILDQALIDIKSARELSVEDSSVDNISIIPERVTVAYVHLTGDELGDNGTALGVAAASKLLGSLEGEIGKKFFYLVTLDRKVYKVAYLKDLTVSVICISD